MSRPDELDFAIRARTNAEHQVRIAMRRQAIQDILRTHWLMHDDGGCSCGLNCESWAAHVEELLRDFTEPS